MTPVPAGEDLAARIARLSPEQRALLAWGMGAQQRPEADAAIPRRDADAPVPLTFAQWRLWFQERFTPGTNSWSSPALARGDRGKVGVLGLASALMAVIEQRARELGAIEIIGAFREEIVGWPGSLGFQLRGEATTLYGTVRQFAMFKPLR
jgi:hypothetical protein